MTDFDLRTAVRAVIDETDLTDPGDIAAKVAEQIPAKILRAVVVSLLRDYVRVVFHSYPPMRGGENHSRPKPVASPSAKVSAIRRAAPGWLLRRVHVGDSYLMLSDCGYDHLAYLAQARHAKAAQTTAAAEWYERAAAAVRDAKVSTLGQLPADALDRLGEIGQAA
jgi:hypothetical protein